MTDISKHDHEIAMKAWRACRPQTVHAQLVMLSGDAGVQIFGPIHLPADMRAAAAELMALAAWFEKRPAKPTETP